MRLLFHSKYLSTVLNCETDESRNKPGRTLRSAEKKPTFTSVQYTPRGKRYFTGG